MGCPIPVSPGSGDAESGYSLVRISERGAGQDSVSFQSPNSGLEKGGSTLSAHLPVKHHSRKNSLRREPASLPPGSLIHPQGLCTSTTRCRELPHPWHCPGFTGPDILRSGSPGSVHTAGERGLSLQPLHSNGRQCRSNVRPPQMRKEAHSLLWICCCSNAPQNKWATENHADLEAGFFSTLGCNAICFNQTHTNKI